MIESRVGRTERAEGGHRRRETGRPAEAEHGDVRQPRPPLGLVHPEAAEPLVQIARQRARGTSEVLEDEHPDAARLAVARGLEPNRPGGCGGGAELASDRVDLLARAGSEEREREVHVLERDDAAVAKVRVLPRGEVGGDVPGQAESAEEAEPFTAAHATGGPAIPIRLQDAGL